MTRRSSARQSDPGPAPRAASPRPAAKGSPAEAATLPWLGERLRRVALGVLAALVVARPYGTSEDAVEGSGLAWTLALLVLAGLGLLALAMGRVRLRWSWADLAAIALFGLVGWSAGHAADRRAAINLAWEWGGLAFAYLLARNLPRTRGEVSALAGVFAASAVAVAAYGLYQVGVELPELRRAYLADPAGTLNSLGLSAEPASRSMFEGRLLHSNEPWSTFALANSLAGFLVGPLALALAVGLENLRGGRPRGRWTALALGALPALVLLVCLVATKSRSAYLGLAAAAALLAWRRRRLVPASTLAAMAVGGLVLLAGLVVAGVAAGQLDVEVLTEAPKSLAFRGEYWIGTWRALVSEPRAFWGGFGPGNFASAYLRYKVPEAAEEIRDPHNVVLDLWATAGVFAVVAFAAALAMALRTMLAGERPEEPVAPASTPGGEAPPPRSSGWLIGVAGLGWLLAWPLFGLNPFQPDLTARWLILGAAWAGAVALGAPAWRRVDLPAAGCAAAVVALGINLLAAGGIGMPAVALALWLPLALGQDLREDRPAGRRRADTGPILLVTLALVWSALAGTFAGAIGPHWRSRTAMDQAQAILARRGRPDFDRARAAYLQAASADPLSPDPWLGLAELEFLDLASSESTGRPRQLHRVILALDKAVEPPRNPGSVTLQRRRAAVAHALRERLGTAIQPGDELAIRNVIARSTAIAARLYPSSAAIQAELAEARADLGLQADAAKAAREALRLDAATPHESRKLPEPVRDRLRRQLPEWEKAPDPLDGPRR